MFTIPTLTADELAATVRALRDGRKAPVKLAPIYRGRTTRTIVGYLKVYYVASHDQYVTIPSAE